MIFSHDTEISDNDVRKFSNIVRAHDNMDMLETLLRHSNVSLSSVDTTLLSRIKNQYESNLSEFIAEMEPEVKKRLIRFSNNIWTLLIDYMEKEEINTEKFNTLMSDIKIVKRLLLFSSNSFIQQKRKYYLNRKKTMRQRTLTTFAISVAYLVGLLLFFILKDYRKKSYFKTLNIPDKIRSASEPVIVKSLLSSLDKNKEKNSEIQKKLKRESYIKERYRQILNELTVGIIIEGSDGNSAFANSTFKKWFSLKRDITGESVSNLLATIPFEKAGEKKVRLKNKIFEIEKKHDGGAIFYIFHDISNLEQMSSRLVDSERMVAVGEMASKITHEIRNPLNTIKINSEYLNENISKMTTSEVSDFLELIVTEVARLENITGSYMDMIRFNREKKYIEKKTSLPGDLTAFLSFYQNECEKRNISLYFKSVDSSLLALPLSSFREIMLNLLKNAWEELQDSGGEIRISGKLQNEKYHLFIEDSGKGIPEPEKEKIFGMYYTNKPGGTGIGLSNTKKRVEEAGGYIKIVDSNLGGAGFVIVLPVTDRYN